MNSVDALTVDADTRPAPIDVFHLRAWARAYLYFIGEFADLPEAVDPLWDYAEQSGLVDQIGVAAAQDILAGRHSA
jgi:hypothetical protein